MNFSEVNFQPLPCCGGDRTLRTGMAVLQVTRLNVVYHRDFRLSYVETFCTLAGIGTVLLQQLLYSILDFFFSPLVLLFPGPVLSPLHRGHSRPPQAALLQELVLVLELPHSPLPLPALHHVVSEGHLAGLRVGQQIFEGIVRLYVDWGGTRGLQAEQGTRGGTI